MRCLLQLVRRRPHRACIVTLHGLLGCFERRLNAACQGGRQLRLVFRKGLFDLVDERVGMIARLDCLAPRLVVCRV
jgi:hypothetical protein